MITEQIKVANLKCMRCANSIQHSLLTLLGVQSVNVDPDQDEVTVTYQENEQRAAILKKLRDLGYPEATEENGLLLQLKSYTSCLMGKKSTTKNK